MDFSEVIKTRRSVRVFTGTKVPEQVMRHAFSESLLAPNSSNMQPWEFYWIKNSQKKQDLIKACLNQSAAQTAQELVVVVARTDTWIRNRRLILEQLNAINARKSNINYYQKIIPFVYSLGFFNTLGLFKYLTGKIAGLFTPTPRLPASRARLFEMLSKTTALACENFMLSIVNQGFSTCPMEGFDEVKVKKILGLPMCKSSVVMVIAVGEAAKDGIWGEQMRLPEKLFIFEV